VVTRADRRRFVDVPWRLDLARHPGWVPPLRALVHELIDTRRNPFYEQAELALWIAERAGRVVGRIGAILNHRHAAVHDDGAGFFGFFECEDDAETGRRLLDTAAAWLADRGCRSMRGPVDPSLNHECGLLIGPFDRPARVLTRWNPPHHVDLMHAAGLGPVRTLYAYWLDAERGLSDLAAHERIVQRVRSRGRLRCRLFDFAHFERDVEIMRTLYNAAWADQWGFVPMTHREFHDMARSVRLLTPNEALLVAEDGDRPVGFMFALPDLHAILRSHRSGRLTPKLLFNLVRFKHRFAEARIILLGVLPEYQRRGVFSLLVDELIVQGRKPGRTGVEGSWIIEENHALRSILEAVGPPIRRWQIFERSIESA
jgi:GNAT superfamily N-acetyltransferase